MISFKEGIQPVHSNETPIQAEIKANNPPPPQAETVKVEKHMTNKQLIALSMEKRHGSIEDRLPEMMMDKLDSLE